MGTDFVYPRLLGRKLFEMLDKQDLCFESPEGPRQTCVIGNIGTCLAPKKLHEAEGEDWCNMVTSTAVCT